MLYLLKRDSEQQPKLFQAHQQRRAAEAAATDNEF